MNITSGQQTFQSNFDWRFWFYLIILLKKWETVRCTYFSLKSFDLFFPLFWLRLFGSMYICMKIQKNCIMKFVMKDVHVGKMIHEELLRQGRTVNWFAKEIYCEKSNVYKMFNRKSIDLHQLIKISEVLEHNFLRDCYTDSEWIPWFG